MMENTSNIKENIKRILYDINDSCVKFNRSENSVKLMAVSKTNPIEKMQIAYESGLTLFGENKVQEFMQKQDFFINNPDATCHIIGKLQTNKVKYLPPLTNFIQTVDSLKLAKEINKQYLKHDKKAKVLIEVNIGDEDVKAGVNVAEVLPLINEISSFSNISVEGLMCIPPYVNEEEVKKYFYKMQNLFIDISSKNIDNVNMNVLSMGMSQDYKSAIEYGSTLIRVGRGIFGERLYR